MSVRRAPSRAKNIDVSRLMSLLEVSESCTSECLLGETIHLMKILRKRVGAVSENKTMQV